MAFPHPRLIYIHSDSSARRSIKLAERPCSPFNRSVLATPETALLASSPRLQSV